MNRPEADNPFRYFNSSPEVIRLTATMYVRFPLSLRNVEDLVFERGIDISYETLRYGWNRFSPLFAGDMRRQRINRMQGFRHWRWHLDKMFVKVNGEVVYLWRGPSIRRRDPGKLRHESRDKAAALSFIKRALKRHGSPEAIIADGLRFYGAAMDELGNRTKREIGRWSNDLVENSLPLDYGSGSCGASHK